MNKLQKLTEQIEQAMDTLECHRPVVAERIKKILSNESTNRINERALDIVQSRTTAKLREEMGQ